ncbi:hypothetical protein NliqN6_0162, partial [Naganishia liquefaciens]
MVDNRASSPPPTGCVEDLDVVIISSDDEDHEGSAEYKVVGQSIPRRPPPSQQGMWIPRRRQSAQGRPYGAARPPTRSVPPTSDPENPAVSAMMGLVEPINPELDAAGKSVHRLGNAADCPPVARIRFQGIEVPKEQLQGYRLTVAHQAIGIRKADREDGLLDAWLPSMALEKGFNGYVGFFFSGVVPEGARRAWATACPKLASTEFPAVTNVLIELTQGITKSVVDGQLGFSHARSSRYHPLNLHTMYEAHLASALPPRRPSLRQADAKASREPPGSDHGRSTVPLPLPRVEPLQAFTFSRKSKVPVPRPKASKPKAVSTSAKPPPAASESAEMDRLDKLYRQWPAEGRPELILTESHYQRLQPGGQLNGDVINFLTAIMYTNMGSRADGTLDRNRFFAREDVVVTTTLFFVKIQAAKENPLLYDDPDRRLRGIDIFSRRLIVVPIHLPGHWILAVVWNPGRVLDCVRRAAADIQSGQPVGATPVSSRNPVIFTFDSASLSDRPRLAQVINRWLLNRAQLVTGTKLPESLATSDFPAGYSPRDVPMQTNSDDCGLFVLHFAAQLLFDDGRHWRDRFPANYVEPPAAILWGLYPHMDDFRTELRRVIDQLPASQAASTPAVADLKFQVGPQEELQWTHCGDPRYSRPRKCHSCANSLRQGQSPDVDDCNFVRWRILPLSKSGIRKTAPIFRSQDGSPPDYKFRDPVADFNRQLTPKDALLIQIAVVSHLLPQMTSELAHIVRYRALRRSLDDDDFQTC